MASAPIRDPLGAQLRRNEEEIEWLLAQLRRQVTRLHQLERASSDESDLRTSRQTIAELRWRLARLAAAA